MGKKAKGSTKSGKFMNPTDRERKNARKKELKKNKKQRLAVRQAVIKQKDPHQILAELERLDEMEFNVNNAPALNEKVLLDKRKKLKDTWDRLLKMYVKDEKEKFAELKRLENEYESKRSEMKKFYDSVKSTQSVSLDEIPLPSFPSASDPLSPSSSLDPAQHLVSPILKKAPSLSTHYSKVNKDPPGPPPGPFPDLSDFEDDEEEVSSASKKQVRFTSQSNDDVDEFLREIEALPKPAPVNLPVPPISAPVPVAALLRPPGMIQAPVLNPILRQPLPESQPLGQGLGQPLGQSQPLMRPPSGPGLLPPPRMTVPRPQMNVQRPNLVSPRKDDKGRPSATIEAKPQLRNLSADATRFTPLALRVKRQDNKNKKPVLAGPERNFTSSNNESQVTSTDDAYEQFMKEMDGIL